MDEELIELSCPHCNKEFAINFDDDGLIEYYMDETVDLKPGEEIGLGGLKTTGMADYRNANYMFNTQATKYQPPEMMRPMASTSEVEKLVDEKIQQALHKDLTERGLKITTETNNEN